MTEQLKPLPVSEFNIQCSDGGDLAGAHGGEGYGVGRLCAARSGGGSGRPARDPQDEGRIALLKANSDWMGACGHRWAARFGDVGLRRKPLIFKMP